jgi:hypothetical protein
MIKRFIGALVLVASLLPSVALADQTSTASVLYSVETVVDGAETLTFLRSTATFPCRETWPSLLQWHPPTTGLCRATEENPAARWFVRSPGRMAVGVLIANLPVWIPTLLLRGGARRTWARILTPAVGVYAIGTLAPNARLIDVQRP